MSRINVRDLLEVIAEGEVHQRRLVKAGWSYVHSTNSPNEILIARDQTTRQKVDVLVHESVHLYWAKNDILRTEEQVLRDTKIIMKRLYR